MTESYAASIASGALARLEGVEKILPGGDQLIITINPDGEHVVHAVTTSVSSARTAFVFSSKNGVLKGHGKLILEDGVA